MKNKKGIKLMKKMKKENKIRMTKLIIKKKKWNSILI